MNVREAILKAADFIEANPRKFSYHATMVPATCRTKGCLLGWIGHFAGIPAEVDIFQIALGGADELLPLTHYDVWQECETLGGYDWGSWEKAPPDEVAAGMRLFAEKHFPTPKVEHVGIPESVRAIFTEVVTA